MKAMVLQEPGRPLVLSDVADPHPDPDQLLIEVESCAVCRTDLHIVDGELTEPSLPLIPGHQIVGRVVGVGAEVDSEATGRRVGVPWLGWTCGHCRFCRDDRENLCDEARFTGYTLNGGYAERVTVDRRFCFPIDDLYPAVSAAPLLCAGLIGYRCLRQAGPGRRLGLYGFGAAAHIVIQVARHQGREVYGFTRPGDERGQEFARSMGAVWAGDSESAPPEQLDAAIIFAPIGALVPEALRRVRKGGVVVCGGIHMSDIPSFSYQLLWGERRLESVANLTRLDGRELLELAPRIPIETRVETFALEQANEALEALRGGRLEGSAVLQLRSAARCPLPAGGPS